MPGLHPPLGPACHPALPLPARRAPRSLSLLLPPRGLGIHSSVAGAARCPQRAGGAIACRAAGSARHACFLPLAPLACVLRFLSPPYPFLQLLVLAQRPRVRAGSRPDESSSLLPRLSPVVYLLYSGRLSLPSPFCLPCSAPPQTVRAPRNQTKVLPAKCTLTHAPHLCSRSRLTLGPLM